MNKKESVILYSLSLLIYLLFSIYNILDNSQWIFDSIISMIFITAVFLVSERMKLGKFGFIMTNIALVSHNLGTFGFYSLHIFTIGYDNVVHFLSSLVAAHIIFDYLSRKLHIESSKDKSSRSIDEQKVILITLVIASVSMLGVVVELIEYGGYLFLGEGEGILFTGIGDSDKLGIAGEHYDDTMSDIFVNTIGTIVGVISYYFIEYLRKTKLRVRITN